MLNYGGYNADLPYFNRSYNMTNDYKEYLEKITKYKLIDNASTIDEANTDYQAIQEWIKEGGTVIDNGENN
jgi:phage gp16-like protein